MVHQVKEPGYEWDVNGNEVCLHVRDTLSMLTSSLLDIR